MRLRFHGRRALVVVAVCASTLVGSALGAASASAQPGVSWMSSYRAPGTPSRYDKVGVIKIGSSRAKNVLVLEPGTSAGSAYFVPLAKWLVSRATGWQVWSVERRENLLEDQSMLDAGKQGTATAAQVFEYYLGYLSDPTIVQHYQPLPATGATFAKQWGMNVAVQDLHTVIGQAAKLGGKVVLGGHSLGGSVVTAYATWNFAGHAGADQLAGLVYDDGASFASAENAQAARTALTDLDAPSQTPWLSFGGIPAPYAGLFETTGALGAITAPNEPSLGQSFPALPADLKPSVPVTNLAQYGYSLNVGTSPVSLAAAQGHLGTGISASTIGGYHGWNGAGALTPITRFATMFSCVGLQGVDGVEWYFPQRLTDDTAAVDNGLANPAQKVLDVHATMGRKLPHSLMMYAFGAALGGASVPAATVALAKQSHIPMANLTLLDRHSTYAHNDPAGAYPHNAFFTHLVTFLRHVATR
jgi:pimeloyl-ACP methyl ester carboxylesterase